MEAPKTIRTRPRSVSTLAEAKQYIDEILKELSDVYRYLYIDIQKIEKRLDDIGA